jgi:hypothetical protein
VSLLVPLPNRFLPFALLPFCSVVDDPTTSRCCTWSGGRQTTCGGRQTTLFPSWS